MLVIIAMSGFILETQEKLLYVPVAKKQKLMSDGLAKVRVQLPLQCSREQAMKKYG